MGIPCNRFLFRLIFLQFHHHDLNGFSPCIDVGVNLIRRIFRKPVGVAGVPLIGLSAAALGHDFHRSANDRDDDAAVFVAMHGQWRIRDHYGSPDFHIVVFKLRNSLRLGRLLRRQGDCRQQKRGCNQNDFHISRAFTPGSSTPPRNSNDAPPPVETWEILSATPADLMAFSESPPPTTLTAPDPATAFAIATVPVSKGGISKTPMGPFQMMVFAPAITFENASTVRGPMSRPIFPSGTRSTTSFSAPALNSDATT